MRNLEERRLGDIYVARLDQLRHIPEQERQHQRPDVAPVHVGIGHYHDLVIADVVDVEALPHAGAYGPDHGLYLHVREDLVHIGLLDVQDLAAQRQYRLEVPVPTLFGRPTRGVALDDVQLAPR